MFQVDVLKGSNLPICHKGHAVQQGTPCPETSEGTINGIPYCRRHILDMVGQAIPYKAKGRKGVKAFIRVVDLPVQEVSLETLAESEL